MIKLEVKSINAKSVFKSALMASVIPAIILLAIMVVVFLLTGSVLYDSNGGLLLTIFYLILTPVLCGLMGMLYTASYNWLAKIFGGLKVTCSELELESIIDAETKNKLKLLDRSLKEGLLTDEEYNQKYHELKK